MFARFSPISFPHSIITDASGRTFSCLSLLHLLSLRSSLPDLISTISISLPSACRPHYEIPETPRAPHSSILQSFDKDLINKVSAATSQSGFESRRRINSVKMTLPALVFASKRERERRAKHLSCRPMFYLQDSAYAPSLQLLIYGASYSQIKSRIRLINSRFQKIVQDICSLPLFSLFAQCSLTSIFTTGKMTWGTFGDDYRSLVLVPGDRRS